MSKKHKNCGLYVGLMIFSILIALGSIPLFIMGTNEYNNEVINHPAKFIMEGGSMNTKMIIATTMSSVGSTMAFVFGLLYVNCK